MPAPKGNQYALGNEGGRPSGYNYDLCVEICNEVANGFNIKTVLASNPLYPNFQTWCNWKRAHKELFDLYINSVQDKSESVDEEIDHIMDRLKNKDLDPSTANVLIQTLKWKAAKYYPKMYGDKLQQDLDITSKGESIVLNLGNGIKPNE